MVDYNVADDVRVIELRTHGVSGTPPESMLNTSAVVQVWGDQTGRFFRPANTLGEECWQVTSLTPPQRDPVPRYREGYHWGKMTSGGLRQALWALLIPFALVNLSQWMVPPLDDRPGRRWPVTVLRALVRVVGLTLTAMVMIQLAVVVADMLAVQCLGDAECLKSWTAIDWFRHRSWPTAIVLVLISAAPIYLVSHLTAQSREALNVSKSAAGQSKSAQPQPHDGPIPNIAAPDFYRRGRATPARTLHATVGLSGVALILSGGVSPLPGRAAPWTWGIALALIVIGVVFAICLDDPRSSGGRFSRGQWVRLLLGADSCWRGLWWTAAMVNLAVAGLFSLRPILERPAGDAPPSQWHSGVNGALEWLFVGLSLICLVAVPVAWVAARTAHRAYFAVGVPKAFQPWLRGITTAVVLPFAGLLGAGLGTGVAQTAQNCLTTSCKPQLFAQPDPHIAAADITMPQVYDAVALLWGITAVSLAALGLIVGVSALWYRPRTDWYSAAKLLQGGRPMLLAWFTAALKVHAGRILLTVVVVAVTAALVAALAVPTRLSNLVGTNVIREAVVRVVGSKITVLQGIGLLALGFIVLGLLYAIYNAYRRPDGAGRSLGVLWDLASFWPTESHPFVPPCYARKAIDDLTMRVRWYRHNYPQARIVLCGHSQGSLLMYATVLRLAAFDAAHPDRTPLLSKVGLVTHGSQLQWAYGRALPDMLSYFSHVAVMRALDDRWFNLVRFTDPLGGAVLSWNLRTSDNAMVGEQLLGHRTVPRQPYKTRSGARVVGNERWLPDPVRRQPIFPPRKHSDYTMDAQWDDAVALAAGINPDPEDHTPDGIESKK